MGQWLCCTHTIKSTTSNDNFSTNKGARNNCKFDENEEMERKSENTVELHRISLFFLMCRPHITRPFLNHSLVALGRYLQLTLFQTERTCTHLPLSSLSLHSDFNQILSIITLWIGWASHLRLHSLNFQRFCMPLSFPLCGQHIVVHSTI